MAASVKPGCSHRKRKASWRAAQGRNILAPVTPRRAQVPEIALKEEGSVLSTRPTIEGQGRVLGKLGYSLSPAVSCVADSVPSVAAAASGHTQLVKAG